MGWDWGSTVGAFIGAGIPAVMTYFGLRADRRYRLQERQWVDAAVVADVQQLLTEIDPMRRAMNLNPAEGAEDQLWRDLERRRDDVQKRLLVLGTGHPSPHVRDLAQRLAVEVSNATVQSKWVVHDMMRNRENPEQMDTARQHHEAAAATTAELQLAVQNPG
jgi:hypothetical protein